MRTTRFRLASAAAVGAIMLLAGPLTAGASAAELPAAEADAFQVCLDATAALGTAQKNHADAVAADEALAAAEAALAALPTTASDGSSLKVTQDEVDRLSAIPDDAATHALAQEKITAIRALLEAQGDVDTAKAAAAATDADALRAELDDAVTAATDACAAFGGVDELPAGDEAQTGDQAGDQAASEAGDQKATDSSDAASIDGVTGGPSHDHTGDAGFSQVGEIPVGSAETGQA